MAIRWSNDTPISPRESLFRVGSLALVGIGIGAVHLVTGFGLRCPFRSVTGWLCPLCGGTHMAEALLRGDVAGAWSANPLALAVSVVIGIRAVGWVVELVRRSPSRHWVPASWRTHWFGVSLVVSVAYVLVRNLFPLS